MCTYTRDKESNFHFCRRLISLETRGYDVSIGTFHGFPAKKNFIVVVQIAGMENPNK